jgi:hypothetical protein
LVGWRPCREFARRRRLAVTGWARRPAPGADRGCGLVSHRQCFLHLPWLRERWQQKTPPALGSRGSARIIRTSAIRAPEKYENLATMHVVHCGPWGRIRQPENSFVSEYEIGAGRGALATRPRGLLTPRQTAATRRHRPAPAPVPRCRCRRRHRTSRPARPRRPRRRHRTSRPARLRPWRCRRRH